MKSLSAFCAVMILLLLPRAVASGQDARQASGVASLTTEKLEGGRIVELGRVGWRYRAGDDSAWADPDFDDSAWDVLNSPTLWPQSLPRGEWNGVCWFRLRLKVDPALAGRPLALSLTHWGASEIYIDGVKVKSFGVVSPDPETEQAFNPNGLPTTISFDNGGEHLIAIRHSVAAMRDISSGWGRWLANSGGAYLGFRALVQEVDPAILGREELVELEAANRFGRAAILFTLALLFVLLFFFYRRGRANLFFSLFAFCVGLNILGNYIVGVSHYDITAIVFISLVTGLSTTVLGFIFLLLFLYTAFSFRIPKLFWALLLGWAALLFSQVAALSQTLIFVLFASTSLLCAAESVRVVVKAFLRKIEGAWIIGIGVLMVVLLQVTVSLHPFFILLPERFVFLVRHIGPIGVAIAISFYLARNFARINSDLEAQLAQVRELSEKELEHQRREAELRVEHERARAEYERRARELEEARTLQLSMLPKSVPRLPNLEIAVYMKPATEVGGDYYDFHVGADGTLTVAIGDATGHGLKAGTMVTAAKTLFRNYAEETDIPSVFNRASRVLKEMNLRGLFMAMTMLKIKENRLVICTAGMPPMLVFRAAQKKVEEVAIRALPLGGVSNFTYQQQALELSPGDTVLLMSDGFPEMFNMAGEMLDYSRALTLLAETADRSPQEIISRFAEVGEQWAGARPQDDDVTFVVLKMK